MYKNARVGEKRESTQAKSAGINVCRAELSAQWHLVYEKQTLHSHLSLDFALVFLEFELEMGWNMHFMAFIRVLKVGYLFYKIMVTQFKIRCRIN